MDLPIARDLMVKIVTQMKRPYIEPADPPKEILPDLDKLKDLLLEYVFYCHQYIDRMIRNKEMIKKVYALIKKKVNNNIAIFQKIVYNIEYEL